MDQEQDTTHFGIHDIKVIDFQFNPSPSQHQRLSIDPHEIHFSHAQFWNFQIEKDYANRHIFSQQFEEKKTPFILFKPSSMQLGARCEGIEIRSQCSSIESEWL